MDISTQTSFLELNLPSAEFDLEEHNFGGYQEENDFPDGNYLTDADTANVGDNIPFGFHVTKLS